ncbi:MAG TPA: hypothetical protein PLP48_08360 [Acholeplasmataceae bacterium]|nr:hypothetical protein [Acholeplasmataceae bacterium]
MKLDVLAQRFNMSMEQGVPVSTVNGYRVQVINFYVDAFVKVPMMCFVFEHTLSKDQIKSIQKTVGMTAIRIESVVLNNNAVIIPFRRGTKPSEKHDEYMRKVTQAFHDLGLRDLSHCPFCGKEDTDSTRVIKGVIVPVHDACAKELYQQITSHVEELEKSNKGMGKSIVFAIGGAVVGAIPTLISIIFFQYMLAILYALIPLASFYGYKYGGAPKKSYVPILISVISLLIVVVMMAWLYGSIAASEGFTFSEAMEIQEFSASFFSDLFTSVLFLAIGVFISWKQMYKQTTAAIKKDYQGLK